MADYKCTYRTNYFQVTDEEQYEKLFSRLYEFSKEKTTLFVSHRLSSTAFCDRIFVISDGAIAENGTHDELMQRNGIYAQLYKAQAKYYETEGNQ